MITLEFPDEVEAYVPVPDGISMTGEDADFTLQLAKAGITKTLLLHFTEQQVARIKYGILRLVPAPPQVIAQIPQYANIRQAHLTARVWLHVRDEAEMASIVEGVAAYYQRVAAA